MAPAEQEATVQMLPNMAACCSVSLPQLRRLTRKPAAHPAEDEEQRRFERICARELLGDVD